MPRSKSKPRRLSLVKFVGPSDTLQPNLRYPMSKKPSCIFLGEIPNMPGHCIVFDLKTGRMFAPYHTENFVELSRDET
jgi:hypothetical protein